MSQARIVKKMILFSSASLVGLTVTAAPISFDLTQSFGDAASAWAASSCFVAGTKILLANGVLRPIEAVTVGDRVIGRGGTVNRVTGIEERRLGYRRLYRFNGGTAFVTAEHPFLTLGGWKAIDVAATARENARLPVKHSNSTQPRPNTSVRGSIVPSPRACSGAR